MDTIFALATARGKAGVAVVRLSGPASHAAAEALAGRLPEARQAGLRQLSWQGEPLDEALVLVFEQGRSFTGEDMAELHVHGSSATITAVLRVLGQQPGLRHAEPGEFTRRALVNGRLDLTQVEGLADLIDAETEAQRRQALQVLSGAVGRRAEGWRHGLVRAAALIEAEIDFSDEDLPGSVLPEVREIILGLLGELSEELAGSAMSERLRDGFEVAIVGSPNVGKSTLLNALAGRDAAITSEFAGTTRDIIEVRMDLDGLPVTLLDTAGIRSTSDPLELAGIERAVRRAETADLRLFLVDGAGPIEGVTPRSDDLVVRGKADLAPTGNGFAVSGLTGEGVAEVLAMIAERLAQRMPASAILVRERHRLAVERAVGAMESARDELVIGQARHEIAAEHLRSAIRALDALVGRVDVEMLLDEIFASFCIGK
jgi:tRNA modification GTPase